MRMLRGSWIIGASVLTSAALAGTTTALAAGGPSPSGPPPKVIQVDYAEAPGSQGADRSLGVHARHTHRLRFFTSYRGHQAGADGRYRSDITDTDIHGGRAKHPWMPNRARRGGHVIRLVHRELHHRGFATLRFRIHSHGVSYLTRARIESSDCESDPPLYPITCEVKVD